MTWDIDYESLNEIIRLQGNVVTATFSDNPLDSGSKRNYTTCQALGVARRGESINLSKENQICIPGDYWSGFAPEPDSDYIKYTVEKKHQYCSNTIARMARIFGPHVPYNLAKYTIISPIEKTTWEPDLVIFTCEAAKAHMLISLSKYHSGETKESFISGSLCRSALAYPLIKNDIQIGLIDGGGRRWGKYRPEELVVSMPVRWFYVILRNQQELNKFGPPDPNITLANLLTGYPRQKPVQK